MTHFENPIEGYAHAIIKSIGEDPEREGLVDTPKRFAKAIQYFTSGYTIDIQKLV